MRPMSRTEQYLARTPRSAATFERASRSLPGGSTRTTVFFPPYAPYIERGAGIAVTDVDGNVYRDFLGNYSSLILGHAHPAVIDAVEAQLRRGSAFNAPTEVEIELAEEIRGRLPSVELMRFTNSGTEATMFAMRVARAFTGRDRIARFDRAYHGTHDTAMARTPGVPMATSDLVLELPWNDPDGVLAAVAGHEQEVAAIAIEPVQGAGGIRVATPAFLGFLRDLCDRIGALLLFDEIIAFRTGPGGAQGIAGVRPDLTTLGKIIGGGFPLAGFGGREDVMALFDARRDGALSHGGTFNGNPVAAAAGLATLRLLDAEAYARLDMLGERLRTRVAAGFSEAGLGASIAGTASLVQVAAGGYQSAVATGAHAASELFMGLILAGFYLAPRGMGAIALPTTEGDVDDLADAMVAVATSLQPVAA
jgi:glutamate-1-semialdehyde 2,1-aminomutase